MNRLLVRSLLLYCSFIAVSLLTYAAGSEFLLALWPLHVGYSLQEAGLRTGTDVLTLQLAGLLVVAGVASFVQSRVGPSGSPAWVVAVVVVVVSLAGFSLGLFGLAYTFLH